MMPSLVFYSRVVAVAFLLLTTACSSTRQIEATPPQPAVSADSSADDVNRTTLLVTLQQGDTRLPEEVTSLTFRVTQLALGRSDGRWITYDAAVNSLTFEQHSDLEPETLLSTQIPAGRYDSVAVTLRDFYISFGPDAGAPLTRAREAPLRLPISGIFRLDRRPHLRLIFEAGASLSRTDDCRWVFVPLIETVVD